MSDRSKAYEVAAIAHKLLGSSLSLAEECYIEACGQRLNSYQPLPI